MCLYAQVQLQRGEPPQLQRQQLPLKQQVDSLQATQVAHAALQVRGKGMVK